MVRMGRADPVKADAVGLHGRDFVVPGEISAGHQRGEKNGCRQNLGDDHRDAEEKMGGHLLECRMIAEKHPDLFEEIDDQKKGDEACRDEQQIPENSTIR